MPSAIIPGLFDMRLFLYPYGQKHEEGLPVPPRPPARGAWQRGQCPVSSTRRFLQIRP